MTELFFDFLIPISMVAVVIVLLAGLWNMMRGGSPGRSQTLMRWRVGLQFVAVVVVMTAFYFASS
jgi:Hypoxia induced protein conserved region